MRNTTSFWRCSFLHESIIEVRCVAYPVEAALSQDTCPLEQDLSQHLLVDLANSFKMTFSWLEIKFTVAKSLRIEEFACVDQSYVVSSQVRSINIGTPGVIRPAFVDFLMNKAGNVSA